MPGVCTTLWPVFGPDWDFVYWWHWTNWLGRLDIGLLGLMLGYVGVVTFRISYLSWVARQPKKQRHSDSSIAHGLNREISSLKSISVIAPFLGLAGACCGILSALRGIDMERNAALIVTASGVAAALLTTMSGIVVATAALLAHNCLSAVLVQSEDFADTTVKDAFRRMSCVLLAYGTTASLILATLVVVFLVFNPSRSARGFVVEPTSLVECSSSEMIHLHVSDSGNVKLESRSVPANELVGLLSKIYATRQKRDLCLSADSDATVQNVASVIDAVQGLEYSDNRLWSPDSFMPIEVKVISRDRSGSKDPDP